MRDALVMVFAVCASFAVSTAVRAEAPFAAAENAADALPAEPEGDLFTVRLKGRLQIDLYTYDRRTAQMPGDTFVLRRARLEAAGEVGPAVGFYVAGDFASALPSTGGVSPQSFLATTDDYVYVRPFGNIAILQVGQYDGPLTFENRTSDIAIDFMERSITVRAFAIPTNKELGAMIHGITDNKTFYYALGTFNGAGPNFRNVDSDLDVLARTFVAPLMLTDSDYCHDMSVGLSARIGQRDAARGQPLSSLTTQGGFAFLANAGLYEGGDLRIVAAELHVPITHHWGVRGEYVFKELGLSAATVASGALNILATGRLTGGSFYAEGWVWLLGDDTLLDMGGRELPMMPPMPGPAERARHGLMLAVRGEMLRQTVALPASATGANPGSGATGVDSYELGVNYWYSRHFRLTFNYALNNMVGTSLGERAAILANGGRSVEQEWLFRIAFAY